ncbi:MAG: diguanylate cyclase/phosphodiesterase with and sensor(s) [Acidimicrobiia bacterium]|nr:diguanylate cyclase/phosphodiesterase with and sensor(s) [Acidimicrobiia bacterium]
MGLLAVVIVSTAHTGRAVGIAVIAAHALLCFAARWQPTAFPHRTGRAVFALGLGATLFVAIHNPHGVGWSLAVLTATAYPTVIRSPAGRRAVVGLAAVAVLGEGMSAHLALSETLTRSVMTALVGISSLAIARTLLAAERTVVDRESSELLAQRLASIVQATTDLVVVSDLRGQPVYVNDAARRAGLVEPGDDSVVPFGWYEPNSRRRLVDEGLPSVRSGAVWTDDSLEFVTRAGRIVPVSQVLIGHMNSAGVLENVATVSRDIRERIELERRLEFQANHDSLTGLPNRTLFMDRLSVAMARAARSGRPLAVLFCDLDNFKLVNDSYGHDVGDELLQMMGERIREAVRPSDTVARFGGDEFVVLCDDLRSEHTVMALANRLATAVRQPAEVAGAELDVSTSIGVAFHRPMAHDRPEALVRDADAAMYRAKELGRDRFEVFDTDLLVRSLVRLDTERQLRRSIEHDELKVLYQPVIDLRSGQLSGFEALVRWDHPTRGQLLPGEFIDLAEETGYIVPLGRWVLSESLRQLRTWRWTYPDSYDLTMSVNVSGRQAEHGDLLPMVQAALSDSGIEPEALLIEMTESVLLSHADDSVNLMRRLRSLGVRLAVDDFGTGYSSLAYLRRFPVNLLKIDRTFVSRLGQAREDDELVRLIVGLAHTLGLEATAEGVENGAQADQLTAFGCDLAQGYWLGRPTSAAEIDQLLARRAGRSTA